MSDRIERAQRVARGLLVAFYAVAGALHLLRPGFFVPIVPAWVPDPRAMVIVTGGCELAGAVGLLVPRLRRLAGVALAAYAVCVFPANIKHAAMDLGTGRGLGPAYHLPRLMLQPLILWWALFAGGVTRWPFGQASR